MFGGSIEGVHRELVPGKRIVQDWRFTSWPDGVSSTARPPMLLSFWPWLSIHEWIFFHVLPSGQIPASCCMQADLESCFGMSTPVHVHDASNALYARLPPQSPEITISHGRCLVKDDRSTIHAIFGMYDRKASPMNEYALAPYQGGAPCTRTHLTALPPTRAPVCE
jgi:hypothetical protein